jgi:hypothetical protein
MWGAFWLGYGLLNLLVVTKTGSAHVQHWAGWLFLISAFLAWYVGTAMMLKAAAGRTVLPLFKASRDANRPGGRPTRAIELEWGEPGIKMGQ